LVVGGAGGHAFARTRDNGSGTSTSNTTTSTAAPSNGAQLTLTQIEAAVDPAVVDITSQIGNLATAAGTGMIAGADGLVLTNNHVISGGTSITVRVHGSTTNHPAAIVGYDVSNDVAVLQVSGVSGARMISDTPTVRVGESVVVIGNALGAGCTPATQGTVSGSTTAPSTTGFAKRPDDDDRSAVRGRRRDKSECVGGLWLRWRGPAVARVC
jgi:S1-C subfamily serine protease